MNEQFGGEKGPASENLEDQKYRELQVAHDEEDRVMAEINKVFDGAPDRAEAEKIVVGKWAPLLEQAMKKSGEALKAWLDAVREAGEREMSEIRDTEKGSGRG